MSPTTRRRLFQVGSFLLAIGLLVLALYGVDLNRIVDAFRKADYRWLAPLVFLIIASNVLRAWRWQILVDALPASAHSDGESRLTAGRMLEASFSSVMIGYMVNNAAPRMGEVARTANLSARTKHRFSSLFGTVVSERIFDMVVLGLAVVSAIGLLFNRRAVLEQQFFRPAWTRIQEIPSGWLAGGILAFLLITTGVVVLLRRSMQRRGSPLARFWRETLRPALTSFREGMATLLRSPRRGAILAATLGMWVGYLLMAYIPLRMLHLTAPHGIGLVDAWILMALGALGMVVPSPGGIGSYHYITIQALVHLYDMPKAPAATYAVLANGAQIVFYTLAGGLAILYQGTGLRPFLAFRSSSSTALDAESDG